MIAALRALKYDWYKGPQYYRGCDHQSVQSVLLIESKKASQMRNPHDVFHIVYIEPPDEKNWRSCQELGHKA